MKYLKWIDFVNNHEEPAQESQKEVDITANKSCLQLFERKRIAVAFILMIILFIFIILRLYQYQVAYSERYYKLRPSAPEKNSGFEVYIPKDLEDCFIELKKMLPLKLIKKIKSKEFSISEYHLNLGLWLRNNWGLWKGSRLKAYFESIGIHHPDDMSSVILVSFHRHLNDEEIRLLGQVKFYQKYWEVFPKIFEKRKKEKVFKEDKLEYNEVEMDLESLIKDLSSEMNLGEEQIFEYEPGR
ncbi:MAG: DUF6794 domain-containing protein [Thermodesulfobacteriota bacterium]